METCDAAPVGHVVPVRILASVLAALLALTVITVTVTWFQLGGLSVWIALLIATVKAVLVALYFMHLRYDRPFNALVVVATLFFVGVFISLALLDVFEYRQSVDSYRAKDPTRYAPLIEAERARTQGAK